MTHNYFWFDKAYYLHPKGMAMGAKFSPSLANLFLTRWEENNIYARDWPEFIFYPRYIDNIPFLWQGEVLTLENFIRTLNNVPLT